MSNFDPPPPPFSPPLSESAKMSFLQLAEKPSAFEPFILKKPKRECPKSKLPPSYRQSMHITPQMLQYSREGLKQSGIHETPVDLALANARDSLRQVYHRPVGTTRTFHAAAAAPLGHPPLAFKITQKKKHNAHHGGSKKRSRKHKKSHRKKSHKRSHKRH